HTRDPGEASRTAFGQEAVLGSELQVGPKVVRDASPALYLLRSSAKSVIGSQWIGSWVTFLNGSLRLPKRFAPVNLPNCFGRDQIRPSILFGALRNRDQQTFRLSIFPFAISLTRTAWNSRSGRN